MLALFLIVLIGGLIALWVTYVNDDEWPKAYKFFEQGMIWFGVFFIIGFIIGMSTVPAQISKQASASSYFDHIFTIATVMAIFAGAIAGTISAEACKKTPISQLDL